MWRKIVRLGMRSLGQSASRSMGGLTVPAFEAEVVYNASGRIGRPGNLVPSRNRSRVRIELPDNDDFRFCARRQLVVGKLFTPRLDGLLIPRHIELGRDLMAIHNDPLILSRALTKHRSEERR